jgi:hypothetical protein
LSQAQIFGTAQPAHGVDFVYEGLVEAENAAIVTDVHDEDGRVQTRRMLALVGYRLAQVLQTFWEKQTLRSWSVTPSQSGIAPMAEVHGVAGE